MEYDIAEDKYTDYGSDALDYGVYGQGIHYTQRSDKLFAFSGSDIVQFDLTSMDMTKYTSAGLSSTYSLDTGACIASSESEDFLYVTGGYYQQTNFGYTTSVFYVIDLNNMTASGEAHFIMGPYMNSDRRYHGCIVVSEKLYAIGSASGTWDDGGIERIIVTDTARNFVASDDGWFSVTDTEPDADRKWMNVGGTDSVTGLTRCSVVQKRDGCFD